MTDMVTNLLDMARIQSGAIRVRMEWQSLEEIVGAAIKSSQPALGVREVTVRIDPEVPLVECDAVLIERVLANLLENAGKFTPPLSPVAIRVHVVGSEVQLSVRDHGPGVPKGQEESIFEKFTRGEPESATPGVGLGLAICRAIVEAHRGRIWAEAGSGDGATFSFTLPLGTPPAIDAADRMPDVAQGAQP